MRILRSAILLGFIGFVACDQGTDDLDASNAFMEAAQALFSDKDAVGRLHSFASEFMESDTGKQVGSMLTGGKTENLGGVGQILAGLGNIMNTVTDGKDQSQQSDHGINLPMLGSILGMLSTSNGPNGPSGSNSPKLSNGPNGPNGSNGPQKSHGKSNRDSSGSGGIDLESLMNVASMFLGDGGNVEGLMGLLPMLLPNSNGPSTSQSGNEKHLDHSSHSWYLPPVLEYVHIMWEHFKHSNLGQTLWRNSGLESIVGSMVDKDGQIKYEELMDSFENPIFRRKWIRSLTNFVADWIAYISDPATQQRHIKTFQYVTNSFLKSQGFPKQVIFDASNPVESIVRIVNFGARSRLKMKIDSRQYIEPAVAYFQDLTRLASEKGFIMSRINANELSHRLSETINNDLVSPLLKTYRAYKWAIKSPECAHHILCVTSQSPKEAEDDKLSQMRATLTKFANYPAAWIISVKTGVSFWSLYGAIQQNSECFTKYPVDCAAFHEEEIRVTTESAHNEL